jgi:hypothetical protein
MDSENHPVVTEDENKQKKQGLQVFGYVVPWWAVVLILLVVLYVAYEKGYLSGVLSDMGLPVQKEIKLKGPLVPVSVESAPEEVKRLFNMANMY